jgi:hypothetical protein
MWCACSYVHHTWVVSDSAFAQSCGLNGVYW